MWSLSSEQLASHGNAEAIIMLSNQCSKAERIGKWYPFLIILYCKRKRRRLTKAKGIEGGGFCFWELRTGEVYQSHRVLTKKRSVF